MGCSSCSTKDGSVPGCKSNGTCGTAGCNKLNVYDWLSNMVLPDGQKPFNIVEVRFKNTRKEFFRNTDFLELKMGDMVAVEGTPGHDIGEVSLTGELVKLQLRKSGLGFDSPEIRALYRVARPADVERLQLSRSLEFNTMHRARVIALALGLKMKLSDVEYQGDGKKAIFFYTAEERVDFRELIKKLADEFKIRVEMRQIGLRQEAGRLGGIGVCGRELCCSTWLTDFKAVTTSAARYQNLAINPAKLAGQCGKLKCCLNFELDSYIDAVKDLPDSNIYLQTEEGKAVHRKTDIFKRLMWYEVIPQLKEGEKYFSSADKWQALPVEKVIEIIEMNKAGNKPVNIKEGLPDEEEEFEPDYSDVVGQDSISRMDNRKKKKKKKNKSRSQQQNTAPAAAGEQTKPQNQNQPSAKPAQKQNNPNRQQQNNNQNRQQSQNRNKQQQQNNKPQPPSGNNPPPQNKPDANAAPPAPSNRPPRQLPNSN